MRLSRVCGLASRQWLSLTLERFDDMTENDKDEFFKNSIQAYIEYLSCLEDLQEKACEVMSCPFLMSKFLLPYIFSQFSHCTLIFH
jgi:hypothetical protein